ncbi:hypothetical protein NPX13_g1864 [Xylaria arbuscula]|uniref:Histone-lysine N-methyltransferase SET9 n=1 Tax=Xylaria arbuscula TaxID=114810 RepID=A0A9W8NLM7_9PEZI|nr:hypothetical protein NPX13_g1864 [Xylaria arbuscula]
MPGPASIARRPPITLAQLSSYDDILTDALVDHAYYWTTIPKNRPSYHASRGIREEAITKIVQSHLIVNPNVELAESSLLATDGLRKFLNGLKTPKEKDDFRAHLRRHEAAITARKYIKKGQPIKYLSGIQVMISAKEDKELATRKKDFSIVVSSRNKCAALFMGPARFANHDCNANARLMITGQSSIEIIATQNIDIGDEITVSYAESYFGEDNCECLCRTCEKNAQNGWASGAGNITVKRSIEDSNLEGYSLRRRRRDDSCASASRTPSVTPDIRPRIRKTKPKTHGSASGRESLCDSPTPHDILREKRKREYESLQSPPTTPAKRLKTLQYELVPVPTPAGLDRLSPGESVSSIPSISDSATPEEMVMTDATTPEEEIQEIALQSPVLTPVKSQVPTLKQEDSDPSVLSLSPTSSIHPISTTELASSQEETPAAIATNSSMSISAMLNTQCDGPPPTGLVDVQVSTTVVENAQCSATVTGDNSEALDQETTRGRSRVRGRPKRGETRRISESTIEPIQHKKRVPGDYTLTPVLLSEPNMAWIHCTICGEAFVQQNAYFTRSSCFRCERHSKLYGYSWPKTEKDGPNDKEERVLDHRTIHRFLDTEEEARIRGRKIPVVSVSPTEPIQILVTKSNDGNPMKRGPGRPRKHPTTQDNTKFADASPENDSSDLRRTSRRRQLSLKAVAC